jgi:hypothetical protein
MDEDDLVISLNVTPENKEKWWGKGEWVDEPDKEFFEHEGIRCKIVRIMALEPFIKVIEVFGGHLCGYVEVPKDHPWYNMELGDDESMVIEVHGGITFCRETEGQKWIGFDCAHIGDCVPSMRTLRESTLDKLLMYPRSPVFSFQYKNMEYVRNECKLLAEQVKASYVKS